MQAAIELLRILLPTAYALVEVVYLSLFLRDDAPARRIATPLLMVTVLLHALFIILRTVALGRSPVDNPLEVLSIMAFAVAMVHLVIEYTLKNQGTGAFVMGVVFVFQLVASALMNRVGEPTRLGDVIHSPWLSVHTGTAILGYSGFAVSAAYGCLFLLLYRELKASHFGRIYERLPSLDLLARMTVRAAAFGLLFLTVAMAAGIVWSLKLGYTILGDPKFVTTLILWIVYGTCLSAHVLFRWPERRVVYFSLIGFLIMLFSMVAVQLLFRSFHHFA